MPAPPNLPPACSWVSTTSTAGLPSPIMMSVGMPRPLSTTLTPPSDCRVTSMCSACPASASSIELSTTSQTRWCRPRSPVEPMYILGRLRTASRPSRTVIALASSAGSAGLSAFAVDVGSRTFCGLTSDTVLLWLSHSDPVVSAARDLHRGTIGQGRAMEAATPDVRCSQEASVMFHVKQPPGTSSGRPPNLCPVYLSATTRKCSGGPSVAFPGKKVASSYSPHAAGYLTARRWPLCTRCHPRSSIRVARTRPGRLSESPGPRWRARALHPKVGHRVLSDLDLEPPEDRRRHQPQLGGPCRRFRPNNQNSIAERQRRAVCGDFDAHDRRPPAHD